MRAATGSASALMLAHSRAGSTGCAAPVQSARSGWLPGRAGCESVRTACARERGARTSHALHNDIVMTVGPCEAYCRGGRTAAAIVAYTCFASSGSIGTLGL